MEEKILIVEDESIIALDLQYGLKDLGYKVIGTADNGQDAIDMAVAARRWITHWMGSRQTKAAAVMIMVKALWQRLLECRISVMRHLTLANPDCQRSVVQLIL